jgi:predicted transcriptional regulator
MKTIMISNNPKSAEQIMNGKKKIEVRKFYIEPPFKVLNYVTKYENNKLKNQLIRLVDTGEAKLCSATDLSNYRLNGKVAFEYTVNKVDRYEYDKEKIMGEGYFGLYYDELKKACLTFDEALVYGDKKDLYGWHISDLKIYDKPKELREFRTPKNCGECSVDDCYYCDSKPITKPPQNFVYCEVVK